MGTHHHSTVAGSPIVSTLLVQGLDLRVYRADYETQTTLCTMHGPELTQTLKHTPFFVPVCWVNFPWRDYKLPTLQSTFSQKYPNFLAKAQKDSDRDN